MTRKLPPASPPRAKHIDGPMGLLIIDVHHQPRSAKPADWSPKQPKRRKPKHENPR